MARLAMIGSRLLPTAASRDLGAGSAEYVVFGSLTALRAPT